MTGSGDSSMAGGSSAAAGSGQSSGGSGGSGQSEAAAAEASPDDSSWSNPLDADGISPGMLTILLIVVLVVALGGGGWGHSRYGAAGWSPAGIILLVILGLYFTGNLR